MIIKKEPYQILTYFIMQEIMQSNLFKIMVE